MLACRCSQCSLWASHVCFAVEQSCTSNPATLKSLQRQPLSDLLLLIWYTRWVSDAASGKMLLLKRF
jgi:hypothetical protein